VYLLDVHLNKRRSVSSVARCPRTDGRNAFSRQAESAHRRTSSAPLYFSALRSFRAAG
jgi:hypothetical protein